MPYFVAGLCTNDPRLVYESAAALTNIASGTSEHTAFVVNAGAVPPLVALLSCTHLGADVANAVREQATWALANIAGDSSAFRDGVIDAGVVDPLAWMLATPSTPVALLRNAAWLMSNLCRGEPPPDVGAVQRLLGCAPRLLSLCDGAGAGMTGVSATAADEIVADVCWGLSALAGGGADLVQSVIDSPGIVPRLVELIVAPPRNGAPPISSPPSSPVSPCGRANGAQHVPAYVLPALRAVGALLAGDEQQAQFVLNHHALACLYRLLTSASQKPSRALRKEACWALSNVTAGSREQVASVARAGVFPMILSLLTRNEPFAVRREAAWVISNALRGGGRDVVVLLVEEHDALAPLSEMLVDAAECNDAVALGAVIGGIDAALHVGVDGGGINSYVTILQDCDGADTLEELQHHAQPDISSAASRLVDLYLGSSMDQEEEHDDSMLHFRAPSCA